MPFTAGHMALAIAILAEVAATTALKSSEGFTRLVPSTITVIGYAVAFYGLAVALRTIPTGVAYAIWSGIGIVLISLLAWIVHGQRLDASAMVGIALILAGVVVLNGLSNTATH